MPPCSGSTRATCWGKATSSVDQVRGPEGAKLIHPDGSETPLELVYIGRDEEGGTHVWEGTVPARAGDQLYVGVLPAKSSIVLRRQEPESS